VVGKKNEKHANIQGGTIKKDYRLPDPPPPLCLNL